MMPIATADGVVNKIGGFFGPTEELVAVVALVLAESTNDLRITEELREKLRQALEAVVKETK